MRGGKPHTGEHHAADTAPSSAGSAVLSAAQSAEQSATPPAVSPASTTPVRRAAASAGAVTGAAAGAVVGAVAGVLATRWALPTGGASVQAATSGISGAASVAVVAACSWVGACAVAAAVVDVERRRIPNRLVLGVLVAGVAASVGLSWEGSARSSAAHLVSVHVGDVAEGLALALAGCALAGLPMLVVRLVRRIGMGDVKLAGALGASLMVLGWWVPLAAVAIAAGAAAAFGVLANRSAAPLAPFLAAGWCAAIACVPMASGFGQ